jgi:heme/copper-type cytochrome/quinol oxidase subunit 3
MTDETVIDVAHLPDFAFGRRDPMWWGIVLLMAIEGMGFALVLVSYFYVRNQVNVWPESPWNVDVERAATATLVTLLISVFPASRVNRAAYVGNLRGLRGWQAVSTLLSLLALVFRALEFWTIPFRWDQGVYGSMVWGALVLHTTHLCTAGVENLLLLVLLYTGPLEHKHLVDMEVNGLYWYFVVAAWLPFYAVFYLGDLIR